MESSCWISGPRASRRPDRARLDPQGGRRGLIELIADADRDVLVGATSVGPAGGEVLGMLALAVTAQLPLDQLRTMIYASPAFHRAVEDAVRAPR